MLGSATFRRVAIAGLAPVVLAIGAVVWLDQSLQSQLAQDAQKRLEAEMQGFAALYDQRRIPALRTAMEFRAVQGAPVGTAFALLDRNGGALAGNVEWPPELPYQDSPPARLNLKDRPYLIQTRVLRGGFAMLAGVSLDASDQTLADMRRVFAGVGLAMVLMALGAAWLAARRARLQVAGMNRDLDRIGGNTGLHARLTPEPHSTEYAQLATHINAMLDRIAHLFDAHQRLGNAVAHEMRTPLARIQTRLSALDLDAAARAGLDDEIRTTIRLFDSLLSIAKMDADTGDTSGLVPLDLSALATEIAALYAPVAEEDGRTLNTDIAAGLTILGDAQLLSQQMSNLIENGLKYTRPGDTIDLSLTRTRDRVTLRVSDNGPGVDTALRESLFAPFTRGAGTGATPGHGLGLSLVRAIALRHGAKPRVMDTEKGFAIEVEYLHLSPSANS